VRLHGDLPDAEFGTDRNTSRSPPQVGGTSRSMGVETAAGTEFLD
jgi:hypothetical protein